MMFLIDKFSDLTIQVNGGQEDAEFIFPSGEKIYFSKQEGDDYRDKIADFMDIVEKEFLVLD